MEWQEQMHVVLVGKYSSALYLTMLKWDLLLSNSSLMCCLMKGKIKALNASECAVWWCGSVVVVYSLFSFFLSFLLTQGWGDSGSPGKDVEVLEVGKSKREGYMSLTTFSWEKKKLLQVLAPYKCTRLLIPHDNYLTFQHLVLSDLIGLDNYFGVWIYFF